MDDGLDPLARTALWTASMRAREHARSDRLFDEPLANLLATEDGPKIMRGFEGEVQRGVEDPALAVRTRFFDDAMIDAARSGVRQFVLVAAGMDTRGYRLAWPESTVLFELDRPALLELKASLLADAAATPACTIRPLGVDLLGDWTTPLAAAGFRHSEPTLWLVEGLFYFLSAHERDTLLKEITTLSATASRLLADYVTQTSLDGTGMQVWREKMAASGHPWKSGCDDPEGLLDAQGWRARVSAYGSPEADYGRWAHAVIEPGVTATRGRYLISAVLDGSAV
ncbi:SAM-dependent methyltransferase [Catellatospora coxensis]|uniref:S-adenosyl-L-methionine-dependent methyltransferase n=1 Tax=Catellatospora coxensis TaxID=310354 RepID=A0A8J3L851_9ACTN|nr:SAM-dependent methyltransferase [Catellatospora coxensis]GIG08040.1 S-adenosyl-L-methionine-dependent methyltransferase [Catellatospora coxensis]